MLRVNHCFRNRFTDTTHFLTCFWIFTCWDWLCFWCFFFRCCWSSFYCCWSLSCCCSLSTICKCIDISFSQHGRSYQNQLLYEYLHLFHEHIYEQMASQLHARFGSTSAVAAGVASAAGASSCCFFSFCESSS